MPGTYIKFTAFSPSHSLGSYRLCFSEEKMQAELKQGTLESQVAEPQLKTRSGHPKASFSLLLHTVSRSFSQPLEKLPFSLSLPVLVPSQHTLKTIQNQIQVSWPQVFPVILLYSWKQMSGFLKCDYIQQYAQNILTN